MKQKQVTQVIENTLIEVHGLQNSKRMPLPADTCTYNVFLIRKDQTDSTPHLHILPPGLPECNTQQINGAGYRVTFREELMFMLQCEHFEPFQALMKSNMGVTMALTDPKIYENLEWIIQRMLTASQQIHDDQFIKLSGLLKVFLVYISRQYEMPQSTTIDPLNNTLLKKFRELLNHEQFEKKAVYDYALALSVTPAHLNETVRKNSGYTVSQLIQRSVIYKAKQAAITSDATVKEVASNLGFHDIAHFSKFFRKKAGMRFSDFKKTFQIL